MKTYTIRLISFSIIAVLFSGCYTQLEVVERPRPYYAQPQPERAYNPDNQERLDDRAYQIREFDEESYVAGYDDGFGDLELYFRDFNRTTPLGHTNQYALGYHDGYSDASWSYYRHRFHTRHWSPYWDPFWYDSYWAFHFSWGWHRPHHFWHFGYHSYYGYNYYGYAYPVYYWRGHSSPFGYGWGGNTWIVYNNTIIDNSRTTINRGPRASGISRDRNITGRDNVRSSSRSSTVNSAADGRSSGVARDNTARSRTQGTVSQPSRDRGTVGRSTPATTGRSSGTVRSGETRSGSSSGGVQRNTGSSGRSSGTVQSGNDRSRNTSGGNVQRNTGSSGRSSGTVQSGNDRSRNTSGGSSSGTDNRRNNRDNPQSSLNVPVITPGMNDGRTRIASERPERTVAPVTAQRTVYRSSSWDTNAGTNVTGRSITTRNDDHTRSYQLGRTTTASSNATDAYRTAPATPGSFATPQRSTPNTTRQTVPPTSAPAAVPSTPSRNVAAPSAPAAAPRSEARPAPSSSEGSSASTTTRNGRSRN